MVVDPVAVDWVCATARGFPDDRRSLEVLEVVRELFGAGKGVARCQHIDRLAAAELRPLHLVRPELLRAVRATRPQVVQVCPPIEQVRRDVRDHRRVPAAVLAQVHDQRGRVGQLVQLAGRDLATHVRRVEAVELEVADIARKRVSPDKCAALRGGFAVALARRRPVVLATRREDARKEVHAQVPVVTHALQVLGESRREGRPALDSVISALLRPLTQSRRHLRRDLGEHVVRVQLRDRVVDHVCSRRRVDPERRGGEAGRDDIDVRLRQRRVARRDLHDAEGAIVGVVALAYHELDIPRLASLDRDQVEPAGLATESECGRDVARETPPAVERAQLRGIGAVECVEPLTQRATRRCGWHNDR